MFCINGLSPPEYPGDFLFPFVPGNLLFTPTLSDILNHTCILLEHNWTFASGFNFHCNGLCCFNIIYIIITL